jgi:hypothetical protein
MNIPAVTGEQSIIDKFDTVNLWCMLQVVLLVEGESEGWIKVEDH